ncbi:MAG: hypothetical protein QW196_07285, partial [Sulfolobales archaeon]
RPKKTYRNLGTGNGGRGWLSAPSTFFKSLSLGGGVVSCESLWLLTKRPIEVKALDIIRAVVVACNPSKTRVVEEFSGGALKVFVEIVSKEPCADYLSPILRYVLGEDTRIVSSECGSVPLLYASTGQVG